MPTAKFSAASWLLPKLDPKFSLMAKPLYILLNNNNPDPI